MHYNKKFKKKGAQLLPSILTQMIFVILAGAILLMIISLLFSNDSDIESAISVCRTSVDAREYAASKSFREVGSAVPMLCKTIDIEIPENKYAELAKQNFTKAVLRNIADRSMDCWYMFGQGLYSKDVFDKGGFFDKNKCFACFTFSIKEEKNYEPIQLLDLINFLAIETYKPVPKHVPICLFDDEKQENCVTRNSPECARKGGICVNKKDQLHGYILYEGWSCDSKKEVCYVPPLMLETYFEYINSKAGGDIQIDPGFIGLRGLTLKEGDENKEYSISEVTGFSKDNLYVVSFISDTTDWGAMIVTGLVVGAAVAAAPFTFGGSIGALAAISVGATAGALGGGHIQYAFRDKGSSIYISQIDDMGDRCRVVGDFNQ
jgi:hypothetical protein